MMLTKIICLIVIIISSIILAQNKERDFTTGLSRDQSLFPLQSTGIWTEVHPLIPRVNYWGVDFVNADTGWAVGEGGAIIKTTNGGQKWIWYESGVENTLKTIYSVNYGQRVIAAGDGGVILISEDAGETWSTLPSGTTDNIWNMQMITSEIGWMVGEGATALKTTDGGLNWIQQQTPYTSLAYWDVCFVDTSFGYICCNTAIVLKTTNGGISWQIQQAGDTRSLFTIYAFDTLWVSAAGFAGKVVYTTNGGSNWINVSGLNATEINKIKFINDTTGFMASTGGFYKSTNKGISWFLIPDLVVSGTVPVTTNLSFSTGREGYVTGGEMLLAKTIDEGENWKRTIVNADFLNVYFKDEQNGFINSSEKIYKTTDGGTTLSVLESFPYSESYSIRAMTFIDSLTGFIGSGTYQRIYKTTNAGVTWYRTSINDSSGSITGIFFFDSVVGFAISLDGKIFKTTDGGEIWNIKFDAQPYLSGISFPDGSIGWVVGTNTYPFEIYKTIDVGENWTSVNVDFMDMNDVYFVNLQNGFITGSNKLYKTTDGGVTWNLDSSAIDFGQGRFGYFDSNNFFITGEKVYRTTNGGVEWIEFSELQGQDWKLKINLINVNSGYLIGNTGLLVKYFDEAVPVELINFNGYIEVNNVHLQWVTATEINNQGFQIERRKKTDKENEDWNNIGFVNGKGTTTEPQSYSFVDENLFAWKYQYRLKQIDFDGSFEYSSIIEVEIGTPSAYFISQNYPNPFNPTTTIKFDLPKDGLITLEVYDILGRRIKTLINEQRNAGSYEQVFNASSLASGVYVYKLQAGEFVSLKKMILLK